MGPGRHLSLRIPSIPRLRLLLLHRRAPNPLRSPTQPTSSRQNLNRTQPPNHQALTPLCSMSSVRSRLAAQGSWTVVPAWVPSASSTPFSFSLRTFCPGDVTSNTASRFGFPQSHRPCCHPLSLRHLHRL